MTLEEYARTGLHESEYVISAAALADLLRADGYRVVKFDAFYEANPSTVENIVVEELT